MKFNHGICITVKRRKTTKETKKTSVKTLTKWRIAAHTIALWTISSRLHTNQLNENEKKKEKKLQIKWIRRENEKKSRIYENSQ